MGHPPSDTDNSLKAMKAYIYDDIEGDQRLPHDSGEQVTVDQLKAIGVLPFPGIELDQVETIARERGYKNRDEINVSKAGLGDIYEEKIKGGRGYFDLREKGDKRWIRVAVEPKDLLIVPAGVYHRFTLDEGDFIHATLSARFPNLSTLSCRQRLVSSL